MGKTEKHSSNKPTVLLVHPLTGFWDGFRSAPCLPLSILHAATCLTDEFNLNILDLRLHRDWKSRLSEAIRNDPIMVGITSMVGPATVSSIQVADTVKRMSNAPVVLGGVHPTLTSRVALAVESVDYVIRGEGEIPLLQLGRALAEGDGSTGDIAGVCSKANLSDSDMPGFGEIIDLNESPEIPYNTLDAEKYLQYFDGIGKYISMETSRGCPFKCSYCYHSMDEYAGWRGQSAEKVHERVKHVKDHFNSEGVYFVDDNFFADIERVTQIAEHMRRLDMKWQVQGVDILALRDMDESYLSFLVESGLRRITVGIETGSDRIRKSIRKPLSSSEVVDTIRKLRPFPVIVFCSFIVNFPGETLSDLANTRKLIAELSSTNPFFRNSPVYQFIPFPGTHIANEMEKDGFRFPEKFIEWGEYSFETGYGADNSGAGQSYYRALYFTTLFSDGKFIEYISSPLLKLFSRLYRPIAILRLKMNFLKFVPEMKAFYFLKDLMLKFSKF